MINPQELQAALKGEVVVVSALQGLGDVMVDRPEIGASYYVGSQGNRYVTRTYS